MWVDIRDSSPDLVKCSVIQGLCPYSSTRNFLGFSGNEDLKPKRGSLSLVCDSDLLKNLAALEMEM